MVQPTAAPYLPGTAYPSYRPDIDGLRAIAVLLVVFYHAFPEVFRAGFVGVDIFFVISGFLISTIIFTNLQQGTFTFLDFYVRRVRRIFPALLAVLLASGLAGWFILLPRDYAQLGTHILAGAGFVSNFVLWNESGYFDVLAESKPLLHLWSLAIEEQFYIVWPPILILVFRYKHGIAAALCLATLASFGLNALSVQTSPSATFYLPATRIWELTLGASAAYLALHKPVSAEKYRNAKSVTGLALLVLGFLTISKSRAFPGWWALLPVVGTALTLSAGVAGYVNKTLLGHRLLVRIGLISYPLYLWHWPLLSFQQIIANHQVSAAARLVAVVCAFLLAIFTFNVIEKPLRTGKHGKGKAIILFVLVACVGAGGLYCRQMDGFKNRFPEIVIEMTQYRFVRDEQWQRGMCFLSPEQDARQFEDCPGRVATDVRPTMLLWGDSHAAHFFPGYQASFGKDFFVMPRTASLCPPILDVDFASRPYCRKINDFVFKLIQQERPAKVVLSSAWASYHWQDVRKTIEALRSAGIKDIELIGPVPQWADELPKLLFAQYKSDGLGRMPFRMRHGLVEHAVQTDSQMN